MLINNFVSSETKSKKKFNLQESCFFQTKLKKIRKVPESCGNNTKIQVTVENKKRESWNILCHDQKKVAYYLNSFLLQKLP